ncbi:hypothetical protein ACFVWG_02090 [Kribbella sp. NPDC058245]|uniref:hypothetical protein n=1 Tax=Kribbella sp. NPDC058245 TaxID=3346399 RepID=UPI0036EACA1C
MPGLILDSGAVTFLSKPTDLSNAVLAVLSSEFEWPPIVPSLVLVECLTGHAQKDARTNLFLKGCIVKGVLSESTARRAAQLRTAARRGSAVDAALVALAEPGGVVLTGDKHDLTALASNATGVRVEAI